MSPEPYAAIENAIEHYRIDDILISTFAGEQSKWLEEGLIEKVKERSPDKPVEHIEAGRDEGGAPALEPAAAAAVGTSGEPAQPAPRRADGERIRRRRPHTSPRPARGASELADRPPDARHPALHRQRGDALRGVLRLVLLPPRRRQRGPALAAGGLRAAGLGRRGQHGDPGLVELHRPLGARVGAARQPPRR